MKDYGFTYIQSLQLCNMQDTTQNSMGSFIKSVETELASDYSCGGDGYCSEVELAHIQIMKGTITKNPPKTSGLPAVASIKEWLPTFFHHPFEFPIFTAKTGLVINDISL